MSTSYLKICVFRDVFIFQFFSSLFWKKIFIVLDILAPLIDYLFIII